MSPPTQPVCSRGQIFLKVGPLKEPLTMVVCASFGAGHSLLCEGINDALVPLGAAALLAAGLSGPAGGQQHRCGGCWLRLRPLHQSWSGATGACYSQQSSSAGHWARAGLGPSRGAGSLGGGAGR